MKKILSLVIIVLLLYLGYSFYNDYKEYEFKKKNDSILDKIEKEKVNITKWTVYGTSLNIEGNLNIKEYDINLIDNVKIVFYGEKELKYNVNYKIENNVLNFIISDKINTGIYLDNINKDKYIVLLKIDFKNNKEKNSKFYSFKNTTKYNECEYYTITKNNSNNRINMYFKKDYMKIDVKEVKLPAEIYDFSIDPGHGGTDTGAFVNNTSERSIVLEYGLLIKKELEDLGYKVFITRLDNKSKNMGVFESYNKDGRINIIQKSKSKYNLSIHLNSAPNKIKKGGIEIYTPNNVDYSFAKSIVDNIVTSANTTYSPNESFRIDNGIYYRYFDEEALISSKKDAEKYNYTLYNINDNTPYMYMIRELGGINTNAYMDGRNPRYGKNLYYNSNSGIESYLLELGFMVNDSDFNNIVNNKNGYVKGIIESFIKKFKNY